MSTKFYLSNFKSVNPRYNAPQAETLNFLLKVHQNSLKLTGESVPIEKVLSHCGVKDHLIRTRHFECPDLHRSFGERLVYDPQKPNGINIQERAQFFDQRAQEIMEEMYPAELPEHLIHVTCTGYVAPSAPQKTIARRSAQTEVTHAYHMGCYASLPAVRMAWGQAHLGKSVDILHNEMCSLHMDPGEHTPEQIVFQSLFGDGHIRYRLSSEPQGFEVLAIHERILPNSEEDMSWIPGPASMRMTLSRHVPTKIGKHVRSFVQELLAKTDLSYQEVWENGVFAIHPGGPKIIESASEALELRPEQTEDCREILLTRGNMSSATLPHVWERMANRGLKPSTPIVSLAFGPGLTIFGGVFRA